MGDTQPLQNPYHSNPLKTAPRNLSLFPRLVNADSRLALLIGDDGWTYAELA